MIGIGLGLGSAATLAGLAGAGAPRPAVLGFDPGLDAGTGADLHVAPTGDDAGPGTIQQPKRTIQAAVDAALPGQTVAVRAGTYRESVTLPPDVHLKRHGAERVTVSGQDVLTGWTVCDEDDDALLGPVRAECYKVALPLSAFVGGHPRAAWPHEDGAPMQLALDWADAAAVNVHSDRARFHRAAAPVTMADPSPSTGRETWYLGVTDPAVLGAYTDAQVAQAEIAFIHFPNVAGRTSTGGFDAATGTVYFAGADAADGYAGAPADYHYNASNTEFRDAYALLNALPRIPRGGWGWSIDGGGATLYVRPADPANLAAGITMAARGRAITPAGGCTVEGLELEGQATALGGPSGDYPIHARTGALIDGLTIRNCAVRDYYNADGDGYGAMWFSDTRDLRLEGFEIDGAYGSIGLFVQGAVRPAVMRGLIRGAEKTPLRAYGVTQGFMSRLRMVDCGLSAHANKASAYEGCDRFVWHACDFSGASGYLTWQEASRVAVVNCRAPASFLDARGVIDQNKSSTASPADQGGFSGESYLLGVEVPPYPRAPSSDRPGTVLGQPDNPAVTFTVRGCIMHGVEARWPGAVAASADNVTTNPDPGTRLPGDAATTAADAWEDADVGDWRTPAGSGLRGMAEADLSAEAAAVRAWLPHVSDAEFDLGLDGGAVDWTARPPGARATLDAAAAFPPLVIDGPAVLGTPNVGIGIAATPPFVLGAPRPAAAYRWQTAPDGAGWSDVPGAAGLAYTPAAGDEGRRLRVVAAIAGAEYAGEADGPVGPPPPPGPAAHFAATGSGPYLVDPANVPPGTTRIRHRIQLRVPAAVDIGTSSQLLAGIESQGFEVQLLRLSGVDQVRIQKIEDATGADVSPADGTVWTVVRDVWTTLDLDADLGAGAFRFAVDGGAVTTRALGGAGSTFQSSRELSYLATSQGNAKVPAGLEIGLIETFLTTGGTETLRKRVEGGAAAVNADPWKRGGDAV